MPCLAYYNLPTPTGRVGNKCLGLIRGWGRFSCFRNNVPLNKWKHENRPHASYPCFLRRWTIEVHLVQHFARLAVSIYLRIAHFMLTAPFIRPCPPESVLNFGCECDCTFILRLDYLDLSYFRILYPTYSLSLIHIFNTWRVSMAVNRSNVST